MEEIIVEHDQKSRVTSLVGSTIEALQAGGQLRGEFTTWQVLPSEEARFGSWPVDLDGRLRGALARRGVARPYTHQASAIAGALAGRDQVVVTPTASGKSLCYIVPVLESIVRDGSSRALFLFPTKALAQDQLHELHSLVREAELDVKTYTYDGDTSPSSRRAVRTAGHVVITNPDMLHSGILPNHTKWVRLFENLRYIVIDELHSYRGLFGSQVAQVLRRLQRICRFYGSDPVFLCSSATIANPGELAQRLCGREMAVIDDNGAPRGQRTIGIFNPPVVNRELGIRQGVINATAEVAGLIQAGGVQTIVFARSRQTVEVLTQYLRAARPTHPGVAPVVRGYRSGYLPSERRAIEAGLRDGAVRTVVATNALELGIDVGGLDAAVLAGYPGTLASAWQQFGRAGRRDGEAVGVLVAGSSPLDQYIATHPRYLFEASVEAGLINPENRVIVAEHLKCAVFELPLDDEELIGLSPEAPALLEVLASDGTVYRKGGRTYWSSEAYPAEEVSLRTGSDENVVIIEEGIEARVIGEVDRASAMTLVHDDAIYIHDGLQYHVDRLDWEELKAYVRPVDVDYYTDAHVAVDLKVLDEWEGETSPSRFGHGEVAVTYLATIFKKIKLRSHENVGWGKIRLPQDDLHTSGVWYTLPGGMSLRGRREALEGALYGLGTLLLNVAPLLLMCDPRDLRMTVEVRSPHTGQATVFLWESVPGGVGLTAHLYASRALLFRAAGELVGDCACADGCPGCVGPPASSLSVKADVKEALRLLEEGAGPAEGGLDVVADTEGVAV